MRVPLTSVLAREPVRVYIGGVLVAVLLLLLAYGLVSAQALPLWLGLVAALLGLPAMELTRAAVTSPATAHQQAWELRNVVHAARQGQITPDQLARRAREVAEDIDPSTQTDDTPRE